MLQRLYKAWSTGSNYTSYPKRIVLPTEFWPASASLNLTNAANESFNAFIAKLGGFLGAELDYVSQNESFIAYSNQTAGIKWLGDSYSNITKYDQVRLTRNPVVMEYAAKFNGAYPFIDPLPLIEFQWGDIVTPEDYQESLARVMVYQKWFRSEMVGLSCSDSIVVYPFGGGVPMYRNTYKSPPTNYGDTYVVALQAVFAGAPDITVPFGVASYNSTISLLEERLPLTVGIVAAPGCDIMLADMVADLASNGIIVGDVKAGKELY